ncbi:MAG TPA: hypothetical protein ENN79_01840 [Desulfobacteraceae bacterium]|nr:hypothetical protein [Desulfobacteraceae bacterium]
MRWWVIHAGLSLTSVFFLLFGIDLLVASYRLSDPFYFIMTFFSSNLIILISAALLTGFCWRMIALAAGRRRPDA